MLEYYRFKVINNLFLKGKAEAACMQLRELQKRYLALCEENAVLKSKVKEFEDALFMERNFVFDGIFYWLRSGNLKQGPFCPNCYNRYGQITRITGFRSPVCSVCGMMFDAAMPLRASGENEPCETAGKRDMTNSPGQQSKPAARGRAVLLTFTP